MAEDKRPQFGNRHLTNPDDMFQQNAWDNVEWSKEQLEMVRARVEASAADKMDDETKKRYKEDPSSFWNEFYGKHENRFFKDRHWLFTEFPELLPQNQNSSEDAGKCVQEDSIENAYPGESARFRIFEMGCGVGNTILPILFINKNPALHVYAGDYSMKAIEILSSHEDLDKARSTPFVCDAANEEWNVPFPENSLDVMLYIFVLSSIPPERHEHVVRQSFKYLKPGGILLLRDYGRYDMAQVRFKKGRCIDDNFYARGDGTLCYFFTQAELSKLFSEAGFEEVQNYTDKRLQVNRAKQMAMYRVWMQCKYRKPES